METQTQKKFEGELSMDNPLTLHLRDGSTLEARIEPDEDGGLPWENGDGYGVVSDWRRYDWHNGNGYKAPGERVLVEDRGWARFYDVQASMKKAREEQWNAKPYDPPNDTPGKRAARAVEADFQNLRAFFDDRWGYVNVVLKHTLANGYEDDYFASLGGIEYGDGPDFDDRYPLEVANDLLHHEAARQLDLSACDHDDEDCMNCVDCGRCSESLDCQDRCTDCGGHDCETTHPHSDEIEDDD